MDNSRLPALHPPPAQAFSYAKKQRRHIDKIGGIGLKRNARPRGRGPRAATLLRSDLGPSRTASRATPSATVAVRPLRPPVLGYRQSHEVNGSTTFSDLAQYLPLETSRSTRASLQLLAEGPFCQALLRDGRSMHLLDRVGLGLPVIVTWFLLADACLLASVTRSAAAGPLSLSVCNNFVRIVRIMRSSIITH